MTMSAFRTSLERGVETLRHANSSVDHAVANRVVNALLECRGQRYFTGVGKSGLAAARMASSLTSIGLTSRWVHGSEWGHGELGALRQGDLVTAVSHSGTTAELMWLADRLGERELRGPGRHGVALLALTGSDASPLARRSDLALTCSVPPGGEALDLLPTGSVVAAHHVFNALLCECIARLELTPADVLRNHPGGQVGVAAAARSRS